MTSSNIVIYYPRRLCCIVLCMYVVVCMLHRTLLLLLLGLVCSGEPTIWLRHNQSFMQPILSTVNQYEPTNMIYATIPWLQRGWQPVAARGLLRRKIPWWWPNLLLKWVTALIFPGGRRGICRAKHYHKRGANKRILQFNRTKLSKSSCGRFRSADRPKKYQLIFEADLRNHSQYKK